MVAEKSLANLFSRLGREIFLKNFQDPLIYLGFGSSGQVWFKAEAKKQKIYRTYSAERGTDVQARKVKVFVLPCGSVWSEFAGFDSSAQEEGPEEASEAADESVTGDAIGAGCGGLGGGLPLRRI